MRAVDVDGSFVNDADDRAHFFEDIEKRRNIGDLRQVFDPTYAVYHQSCGDNSHGSVFSAADLDFAMEFVPAVNDILRHRYVPPNVNLLHFVSELYHFVTL